MGVRRARASPTHERQLVRPWIPLALVFFALGVGIAYFVLPFAATFLLSFPSADLQPLISREHYFDFVTTMFLAFGLVLEFPILLFGLSRVEHRDLGAAERVAPDGDPRDRDLRGGDHAGRRPRQPDRPGLTMYILFEGTIFFIRRSGK